MARHQRFHRDDLAFTCYTSDSLSTLYILRDRGETRGVFTLEDAILLARRERCELCDFGHLSFGVSTSIQSRSAQKGAGDSQVSLPVLSLMNPAWAPIERTIPFPLPGPMPVSTPSKTMRWRQRIQGYDLERKQRQVARWLRQDRIVEILVQFRFSRSEVTREGLERQRRDQVMRQLQPLLRFGSLLEEASPTTSLMTLWKVVLFPHQRLYASPFLQHQRSRLLALLMARQRDKAAELNAWLSDGEGVLFL